MSGFRCQFYKGSLTKVHYPKLYNMAHLLSFNVFTASKGSNNYILFVCSFTVVCISIQCQWYSDGDLVILGTS